MSLFNQLLKVDDAGEDENQGDSGVGVHGFCSGLYQWAEGIEMDGVPITRAIVESELGIAPGDVDLTWLKSKYDASTDKAIFIAKVEQLLFSGEARKFGRHIKGNFVAAVNSIG